MKSGDNIDICFHLFCEANKIMYVGGLKILIAKNILFQDSCIKEKIISKTTSVTHLWLMDFQLA